MVRKAAACQPSQDKDTMTNPYLKQTSSDRPEISRYETTSVYTHPEAKVDIVLVHGLNGQPDTTWTANNNVFWPLDLLPAALKDSHANIMVYGYNADVYSSCNDRTPSSNFIHQHAQSLVTNLTFHRRSEGTFKNPIIWVCHSLGGILVKRALLYSSDTHEPHLQDLRSIFVSTFGLIFLGTPHIGSDAASWGLVLQAMADAVIPKRVTIVDANSAGPLLPGVTYYGIEATHSNMCKFESTSSPGFRNIATTIHQWVNKAPYLVQGRWFIEEQERYNRAIANVRETMSPFASHARLPKGGRSNQHSSRVSYEENYNQFADQNRELVRHRAIHSATSLNADMNQWESGLPVSSDSMNSLPPLPSYQLVPSHRQLLSTGESFSTDLPNSFFGGTLCPPSAALGGYRSQLTLPNPAPRPRTASPRTPAFQRVGYVPPVAAGASDKVASDYSAWQLQQEQENYQGISQPEVLYPPIQDIPAASTGMTRSGSGSFQFDVRPFQAGQSQPAHLQTLYPSEIESPSPENKDDGT
ncbi:protein serac1 [Fusarium flagelliforme]|uniref:Protein serac1 n=1 Tax=Fusarium flagelliforme TaxID=2675880 RepID=A0A395MFY5_9HYPO|nr:protein serac1 [Fusarium flagelliforme]